MEIESTLSFCVSLEQDYGLRIDQYLCKYIDTFSRSFIQKLIKEGQVSLNGRVVTKARLLVAQNDQIEVLVPAAKELEIKPQKMDLDIIYEDQDIILVNKPKGMVVHPAPGHYDGTLVNGLLYHCQGNLSGINGVLRPGIVHRIDMDTTGVIVACKNDKAHQSLSEQLSVHSITRQYRAIVYNNIIEEEGVVDAPIGRHPVDRKRMAINNKNGKRAVTHYKVMSHLNGKYNDIQCQLETGRTHQIRVHMTSIGHPLLGDAVYGPKKTPSNLPNMQGQCLHAMTLGFIHPTKLQYVEFEAPLPEYYEKLLFLLGEK